MHQSIFPYVIFHSFVMVDMPCLTEILHNVILIVANRLFQSFSEEIVGGFTIANISYTLMNLEFAWVKF